MTTFSDRLYHLGSVPVGSSFSQPVKCYFVSKQGNDGNDGTSWERAKETIQAGVDAANIVANTYLDVDVYISSGYYSETVVVSNIPQGLNYSFFIGLHATTAHYGAEVGRLRIIGTGLVHITGGTAATKVTMEVGRPNTELWNLEILQNTLVAAAAYTSSINSRAPEYVAMPALMVIKENNYSAGTENGGHGSWCRFYNCDLKGAAASPYTATGGVAAYLRGANNSRFYNCDFQNAVWGLIVAGSFIQVGHDNQVFDCRFQGNTYDLVVGGDVHTQLIRPSFMDDGSTKVHHDDRWGASSDCCIIDANVNGANLGTTGPAGWTAVGTKFTGATTGDTDLSA